MNEQELIKHLKSHRWSIQGFNGMPLYLDCAASESGWLLNRIFGPSYSHFFYLFSKGRAYMYYDEEDWERMCDLFYQKIQSDTDFEKLERDYVSEYEKTKAAALYDPTSIEALSDSDLVGLANRLFTRLIAAVSVAHIIEGVTFGSEKRLKSALARSGDVNEMEFSVLCSPTSPSFLSDAQQRLWQIREATEKDALIETYIKEFGWTQTTYLGPKVPSPSDVRTQAETLSTKPVLTDYAALVAEKESLKSKYGLSDEERHVVHIIEKCFAWQDDRKKHILQTIFDIEPVLLEISRRFDIELMPLKFATSREFSLDKLTDFSFKEELGERCKKSAVYVTESGYQIFTNGAFDTIADAFHITMADDVKELKGTTAAKGYAKGRVRICESVSDIDKFEVGDILVASMTRPEYLPAMQKAIAFVTNEGGVTCHAAIVAREMNKPCVIGTKIATQILKDGDVVEVDADKGIVRKLTA